MNFSKKCKPSRIVNLKAISALLQVIKLSNVVIFFIVKRVKYGPGLSFSLLKRLFHLLGPNIKLPTLQRLL